MNLSRISVQDILHVLNVGYFPASFCGGQKNKKFVAPLKVDWLHLL